MENIWITKVVTNNVRGSVLKLTFPRVTFKELWDAYPDYDDMIHINKATGEDAFENHCAINISETLQRNGITMKSFKGVKCYHKCPRGRKTHALRAQELANWLKKRPFPGCPSLIELRGDEFREKLNNKTGIIFFKDYWQRSSEIGTERRTGDHIDLWDGRGVDKLAKQGFYENFITNTLGMYWDGIYSDKNKSKKVLFWEIN